MAITEKFLSTRDPPINFYIHLSFIDYFVIIKITDIINIVIKGIIIIIIIIIIITIIIIIIIVVIIINIKMIIIIIVVITITTIITIIIGIIWNYLPIFNSLFLIISLLFYHKKIRNIHLKYALKIKNLFIKNNFIIYPSPA